MKNIIRDWLFEYNRAVENEDTSLDTAFDLLNAAEAIFKAQNPDIKIETPICEECGTKTFLGELIDGHYYCWDC